MKNSKPPITSKQTYQLVTAKMKTDHFTRIMFAMRILSKPSSMHEIAEKAGMDLVQVGRRMSELELDGVVEKRGKGLSESNRPCALYALVVQSSLSQVHLPENMNHVNQLGLFG